MPIERGRSANLRANGEVGAEQLRNLSRFLGKSIDQIHASKYGQDTVLPSLECTTEDMQAGGGCGGGYSCVYKNVVAWASATEPLPATLEPRIVFEQLVSSR